MYDKEWAENEERFNKNQRRKEQNLDKYAKSQVKRTAKISIETSAIGALSDFENEFGYIWAHGTPYNELTDKQKDMRDRWLDIRDNILARAANGVKLTLRAIDRTEIKDYQEKKFNTIIRRKDNGRE